MDILPMAPSPGNFRSQQIFRPSRSNSKRNWEVDKIAEYVPAQKIDSGPEKGKLLVLGWGSTFGAIKSAVAELQYEGYAVSHAHLRYLRPFPKNLGEILKNF